jgi:hypothetical protein
MALNYPIGVSSIAPGEFNSTDWPEGWRVAAKKEQADITSPCSPNLSGVKTYLDL